MTPTDELIAALRDAAEHDYTAIHDLLLTAADRLASLTAPVGEWETTDEERRRLTLDADNVVVRTNLKAALAAARAAGITGKGTSDE